MWPRIFINYRREDSPGSAGRLYDRLAEEIPGENLFMDVDAIAPGVDFVSEIERAVESCDVFLVVIGRNWLLATDRSGNRRLDDVQDFVRLEIATALNHDVRTIPILVDGATMPAAADLPADIQALVRRNAVEISHQRFSTDTARLVRALAREPDDRKPKFATSAEPRAVAKVPAGPATAQQRSDVPLWRIFAVAATVFAIISSGAIAGSWLMQDGAAWWYLQIGPLAQIWVGFNVMIGPALAAKLWLPGLTLQQFLGILGATLAALVAIYAIPQVLNPIFLFYFPEDPDHGVDTLLWKAFVGVPVAAGSGLGLGYFLAQALRSWFPDHGGPGFVLRMAFIWMLTGTACSVLTLLLIALGEATIVRSAGAEGAAFARERIVMWSDTVLFGLAWAAGLLVTFRFAGRSTANTSRP